MLPQLFYTLLRFLWSAFLSNCCSNVVACLRRTSNTNMPDPMLAKITPTPQRIGGKRHSCQKLSIVAFVGSWAYIAGKQPRQPERTVGWYGTHCGSLIGALEVIGLSRLRYSLAPIVRSSPTSGVAPTLSPVIYKSSGPKKEARALFAKCSLVQIF